MYEHKQAQKEKGGEGRKKNVRTVHAGKKRGEKEGEEREERKKGEKRRGS
jgi:hypothetical protein